MISESAPSADRGGTGGARLVCLGPVPDPPIDRVTSAAAVAITDDGRLVLAELDRGPDLPGGHVRRDETSVDETVRREAWEEIRARLGELRPVEVIESDRFGPGDLTYMVIRAARVHELAPWVRTHESAGRLILAPAEFLRRYRGDDPALMRHLVTAALAAVAARS